MASTTSRMSVVRGRPPVEAGMWGSIRAHCASVTSLGYVRVLIVHSTHLTPYGTDSETGTMRKQVKKAVYRIRNWREYNRALVRRGSLTVWIDEETVRAWHNQGPPRWGAKFVYSDLAPSSASSR